MKPAHGKYRKCPMCGSAGIALGSERLSIPHGKRKVQVTVRRWACAHCGEKFLTPESRQQIDIALGLARSRKSA